ncbi:M10 family metallopeptidase [Pararhizobium arenae]|uniref:M10 family metallopeptidase n=1 Tax=Pararhizobium arenae TaxID=1856850 RepID=UPI00094AD0A6|nr:M10 family metallopeptidase [Pararhizobium arenae]
MATKPSLTTTQAGEQLTRNDSSWAVNLAEKVTITYAYRTSIPSGYQGDSVEAQTFEKFTASQIAVSEKIFDLFEEVCGVTLKRVAGTNGYSNAATMLLGNYSDAENGGIYGYSYGVGSGRTSSAALDGDFWYNLEGPNSNGSSPQIAIGSDDYNTIMHELGHSLGLEHPTDYPENFDYERDAAYRQDSLQYTVMSYFSASETGAVHQGQLLKTLGLHDIAALQRLYGANMTTRTGDDTYGFGGKGVYGLSKASDKTVFSIWDAGGRDTLNFSKYTATQTIDLNAEKFSSVGGLKWNISIAKGVTIENAVGGSGADTINGNKAANLLSGGAGKDTLNGNAGNDRLIGGSGYDSLDGGTGQDTADYSSSTTTIQIALKGASWANVTNQNDTILDRVRNIENLTGGSGDDVFVGDGFSNRLSGKAGSDYLDGGAGSDILTGGSGNDFFVFGAVTLAKLGLDLLIDFATGDKITLLADTFTGLGNPKDPVGLSKGDFSSGTSVKSMAKGDHLFFDTDDSWIYYDNDGAGTGGSAIKFAELDNSYKVTYSDFLIV